MKDLLKPFSFSLRDAQVVGRDLQLQSVRVCVYMCVTVELMLPILSTLLLSSAAKRASLLISLVSMSDCRFGRFTL